MNHKIEQKLKISQMKKQNYNENLMRIKTKMKSKLMKIKADLEMKTYNQQTIENKKLPHFPWQKTNSTQNLQCLSIIKIRNP